MYLTKWLFTCDHVVQLDRCHIELNYVEFFDCRDKLSVATNKKKILGAKLH